MTTYIIAVIVGILIGAGATFMFMGRSTNALQLEVATLSTERAGLETYIQTGKTMREQMEQSFKALSSDVLAQATSQLTSQAAEKLKTTGDVIAQDLTRTKAEIGESLGRVTQMLASLGDKTTSLDEGIKNNVHQVAQLARTTHDLQNVLSSSQARGAWGERMVEDIIQKLGMVEGINYVMQETIKSGERPDFTFRLPEGKVIHMDVKFPIDQYEVYVNSDDPAVKENARKTFMAAVRGHVKTLAGRKYVDVAEGTVDYLIMFIPNEAIYAFIHTHDPELSDYAMERRVVLCSPITLYAVLSLVRQSIKSFAMEEKAGDILALLEEFRVQWNKYTEAGDKVGEALARAQKVFDDQIGTRTRMLGRTIDRLDRIEKPQLAATSSDPTPLDIG